MLYSKLTALLENDSRKEIKSILNDILHSDRNKILKIHQDYYDGKHWSIDEGGEANTTRSGKLIWGKYASYRGSGDDKLARRGGKGNKISFHEGQLQIHNYIKLFTNTYQDFILGQGNDEIEILFDDESGEDSEQNRFLKEMWVDSASFAKEQLARMVVNTIAVNETYYDSKYGYGVSIINANEYIPIYRADRHIGSMRVYTISADEAKELYDINIKDKDEDVIFADVYYPRDEEEEIPVYANSKIVDGIVVDTVVMPDELQFDPFTFVSNLDHPFRKFDEHNLEDSEIFNWIDRNDALNANETIEFVSNQYLAMPKISLDLEVMEKMNIDITDPALQRALSDFQYFPGSIDSLPIKLQDGKTIPPSFYTGKDTIIQALFEDAGIPRFIINGEGMSNISAETVTLGLSMLVRKISQKREQLIMLFKQTSIKALKAKGLIASDLRMDDIPIEVNLPDVVGMNQEEFLDKLFMALEKGVITKEYATEQYLKAIGKEEDFEDQIVEMNKTGSELLQSVEKRANEIKQEREAKRLQDEEKMKREELNRINAEIESIQ